MVFGMAMSDTSPIYCGVPQGSVMGAVLFCMYTMPLEDTIFHHGLQYMTSNSISHVMAIRF